MNIVEEYENILGSENVKIDEPMNRHTTFKIGGTADIFVSPDTPQHIAECIEVARKHKTPYYILGNGSNVLVKDKGFRGVIIHIGKNFDDVNIKDNIITARSGALLSKVAKLAAGASLTGMEFASGIPGTLGGAVCMNAGAYGGEIKDICESVMVLSGGKIKELSAEDCFFRYRGSRIMDEEMIVLEVKLKLEKGDEAQIKEKMAELNLKRNSKQPVEFPSAGSTFKRPAGYFAAALIEECGLKGLSVGQAQVSPKHSGFIVNNGGATASDVLGLIEEVKKVVRKKTGVLLEPEIRIIGD
ncbi:MAG: UDP-N-acetylmuramate dehydrogenase [Firmicutes bacterium]|nr:UDP-N-acetylmuramate dehydrogenase [Bacillota bacterium]